MIAFDQTPDDPGAWVEEISAGHLARYKMPRTMVAVESVKRGPNGKPDLTWARKAVLGEE